MDNFNIFKPVKIVCKYPSGKEFCIYGFMDLCGDVYEKENIESTKIEIPSYVYTKIYDVSKDVISSHKSGSRYCVKSKSKIRFVPDQDVYFIICLFILIISFIFKGWYIIWIITIIFYLYKRNQLRKKYHLSNKDEWEEE